MRTPALLIVAVAALGGCASGPEEPEAPESRVVARIDGDGTLLTRGPDRLSLDLLDPWRVARLARAIFPSVVVEDLEADVHVDLESRESAESLLEAAKWTEALVLARRRIEPGSGPDPDSDAGAVAEAIRRWIVVEGTPRPPDWESLSLALERPSIWRVSPVTAGMGSIIFAGMVLRRGDASPLAKEKAAGILSRAVAARDVPGWLAWIAYRAWSERDFLASDESP